MVSFLREFCRVLAGAQEVLAAAGLHCHGPIRRTDRADQGLGGCAVHLHDVLTTRMRVLGISAFYHDSAAALIDDGRIVAAAQEERFTRKKFDADYPRHRGRLLPQGRRHHARGRRLRRLLRQAIPEVRAPARNLSHLQPTGVHVIPHGAAVMAARKAVLRSRCSLASSRRSNRISTGTSGLPSRSTI